MQYIISLAACGMLDGPSAAVYERTAERLQRLREHEAAWREVAWSDGSLIPHMAARDLPTTSSGGVLAFLRQSENDSGDTDYSGDRLFLLRVPSRLRGIPGESWELSGLGEMSNVCIDAAQNLLLFERCVQKLHVFGHATITYRADLIRTAFTCELCRLEKSIHQFFMMAHLIWEYLLQI